MGWGGVESGDIEDNECFRWDHVGFTGYSEVLGRGGGFSGDEDYGAVESEGFVLRQSQS